jgi:protein tyrosine phosphatase
MFASKIFKAKNALLMTSNGGGLKITKKCKIQGYKYLVWFSKKAITNIICLKNLIKCYRVTYDSKLDTTFVVHCSAFGLPDLLFEMHPCGLHVCYPKKMGEFGFVQTVEDNMKLFSKRQIAGAVRARDSYKKLIYPSTADYRVIVSVGGVPESDVTIKDIKATEVIWGQSVLKLKANTVRRNGKRVAQSIVKVPRELIKLQQDVELAIDCFFVNKHIFFTTYSTKICFTNRSLILHTTQKHVFGKHSL